MTQKQMEIADYLDEMPVGETVEIEGHFIKRESPTRYVFDGERDRLSFVQVCDRLK